MYSLKCPKIAQKCPFFAQISPKFHPVIQIMYIAATCIRSTGTLSVVGQISSLRRDWRDWRDQIRRKLLKTGLKWPKMAIYCPNFAQISPKFHPFAKISIELQHVSGRRAYGPSLHLLIK